MGSLAFTWWGHASTTVELGASRIAFDPLLTDRLIHLRRLTAPPTAEARVADVIAISHLHLDHLHLPSLRQFAPDVPILVPRGGESMLRSLGPDRVHGVAPGETLDVGGLRVSVLTAEHDGRRGPHSRYRGPALGYRVDGDGRSCWFPGDTELHEDMASVGHVDLALVPIGGWGPNLEDGHMDPVDGARAVELVGATTAVPVHWGTFWITGLEHVRRRNHHHLFTTPGRRFVEAVETLDAHAPPRTRVLLAPHGERIELDVDTNTDTESAS